MHILAKCTVQEAKSPEKISSGSVARRDLISALKGYTILLIPLGYSSFIYCIITSQRLKKPTITEIIKLHRLHLFGHVQRMEQNKIPKRELCMNFETTRSRGRPRNRWQDEVREDGRRVGGEEWQKKSI
jgi:hypothetical protein